MSALDCTDIGVRLHPVHRRFLVMADGRIWRKRRRGIPGKPWWEDLVPFLDQHGYPGVHVSMGGENRLVSVHALVLEAFVGPRPAGQVCRHLDGEKTNNRLANLQWGTGAENWADMVRHGRAPLGSRQIQAKLTEADVLEIRRRAKSGKYGVQRRLAREYGVSDTIISHIVNRKAWCHVS